MNKVGRIERYVLLRALSGVGSALAVSIMVVLMVLLFTLRRAQPAADAQ